MNGDEEQLSPAEAGLRDHLNVLRGGIAVPADFAQGLVRTARWQRAVRQPLHAAGLLLGALGDGLGLLARSARRGG